MKDWHIKCLKRIMFDMHLCGWHPKILSKFDAKQMVDNVERAGAEALVVWAKDHWGLSFYPTKVGIVHPRLGQIDVVGQLLEQCKERGISFVAYYSVGTDAAICSRNPNWVIKDVNGEPAYKPESRISWDFYHQMPCINSPYRDYALEQIREITANYEIDGFWLDMTFYGFKSVYCYCEHCERLYHEMTGDQIPRVLNFGSPEFQKWYRWRRDVWMRFLKEAREDIKGTRPDVAVTHNFWSNANTIWRWGLPFESNVIDDYLSVEAHFPGHLNVSIAPRLLRATGKPFEVLVTRYTHMWDWGIKPLEQLIAESIISVANGGAICINDHPTAEGRIYPIVYDRIKEVFNRIDSLKDYLSDVTPLRYSAILYSEVTKDLYGAEKLQEYSGCFNGVFKAMLEAHVPLDILEADTLTPERLKDYKVIVLPNYACMSDNVARTVDRFVSEGGGLIATFDSSLYTEERQFRGSFGLRSIPAEYLDKLPYNYTFVQFQDKDDFTDEVEIDIPISLKERSVKIMPTARSSGYVVYPATTGEDVQHLITHPPIPPPGKISKFPAIAYKEDTGRSVYFASKVGSSYALHSTRACARLLRNTLFWAGGTPDVKVVGPSSVEAIFNRQKRTGRVVIHLVNFPSQIDRLVATTGEQFTSQENFHVVNEIVPIYDLEIVVDKTFFDKQRYSTLRTLDGKPLKTSEDSASIRAELPKLSLHETIIIE